MEQVPDWNRCDERVVREIVERAEVHLQSLLQVGLSMNQRAGNLGGVFVAAATALIAGLLAIDSQFTSSIRLYSAGGAAAGLFLCAAVCCLRATFPLPFNLPGNAPQNWYETANSANSLLAALGGEAENYQQYIDDNRRALRKYSGSLKVGLLLGTAAPVLGAAAYLVAMLFQ